VTSQTYYAHCTDADCGWNHATDDYLQRSSAVGQHRITTGHWVIMTMTEAPAYGVPGPQQGATDVTRQRRAGHSTKKGRHNASLDLDSGRDHPPADHPHHSRTGHLSEEDFQQQITDYCDLLGLKWHHETDSRRTRAGWLDLVIAGNRVIFAELKSDKGKITTEQQQWIDRLAMAGAEVYVWRPADWPDVQRILNGLGGRRVVSGS
jgi:hypothetical protein